MSKWGWAVGCRAGGRRCSAATESACKHVHSVGGRPPHRLGRALPLQRVLLGLHHEGRCCHAALRPHCGPEVRGRGNMSDAEGDGRRRAPWPPLRPAPPRRPRRAPATSCCPRMAPLLLSWAGCSRSELKELHREAAMSPRSHAPAKCVRGRGSGERQGPLSAGGRPFSGQLIWSATPAWQAARCCASCRCRPPALHSCCPWRPLRCLKVAHDVWPPHGTA